MTDRLLKTALTLAAKGIAVFPIAPHGKVPMTPHGCRNATRDTATIRQWWTRDPIFNIGAACGAVSGIWVLDVDTGERDGEAHLNALEQQHGQLPNTVSCITGGGGRHLYFRWPKDRDIRNSVNRVAMGVDVRAGGGYVVVPPSTHPSGRFYVWAPDCADRFAEAPDWLLDLATRVVRFPD